MDRGNIPTARRKGDPAMCQKVWDAIKHIRQDRKSGTADNIIRFVNKNFNVAEKNVEREIPRLVNDGLIIQKTAVTTKGANKGSEQIVYSIPTRDQIDLKSKHDWYCFKCHKAGEVVACTKCPRVYHIRCIGQADSWDTFVCQDCQDCKNLNETPELQQREINYILSFVVARLEDNFPADFYLWNPSLTSTIYATSFSTDRCVTLAQKKQKEHAEASDTSDSWRVDYLLRQEANLGKMNSRADRQVYKNFEQFRLDARTILHNVSIFHGEHSPTADTARLLLKKCFRELEEAKLCTDCYIRCNEQENDDWFCEPCDPPHQLVYAKAKGYPFWPAKVMSIVNDKYDVRFFGGAHDRSKIDKSYILPIDWDINEIVTKRSTAWKEAMKELEKYQKKIAELASDVGEDDVGSTEADLNQDETSISTLEVPLQAEVPVLPLRGCVVTVKRNSDIDKLAKKSVNDQDSGPTKEEPVKVSSRSRSQPVLQSTLDQFCRDELISTMETVEQLKIEITQLRQAHSQEIDGFKQEIARLASERDLALADARIQEEQNKILKEEYEEKLKITEKKYEEQLEMQRIEHREETQPLQKSFEERMEKMRTEYREQMQTIEANHSEQNKINEKNREKKLEGKIEELSKEYEIKMEILRKESEKQKQSLEDHHKEEVEALKEENRKALDMTVKEVRQEYEKQIQTLISTNEEKLKLVREDCHREIQANKNKQWCAQCRQEGAYHCCLSVFYCSTACQHEHWSAAHKRICARKKQEKRELAS